MRTWSEKNGRADIGAYGFSPLENVVAVLAGLTVVAAAIFVINGLS